MSTVSVRPVNYSIALLWAVLLHAGLLALLVFAGHLRPQPIPVPAVIHAAIVHAAKPVVVTERSPAPKVESPIPVPPRPAETETVKPTAKPQEKVPVAKEPPPKRPPEPVAKPKAEPALKPQPPLKEAAHPQAKETAPAKPVPPPKITPHIDQQEADAEMAAIQQEADSAAKAAAQKLKQEQQARQQAAEDAAVRQEAEQLAGQERSRDEARIIDAYRDRIQRRIRQAWRAPPCARNDMSMILSLSLLPDGTVVSVTPQQKNTCLELSVESAIRSVGRLPVPTDPVIFDRHFRSFPMRFRPEL